MTLSAIQFDCFDNDSSDDTDSSDVGNTFVDSALSEVTAITFIEKISALVAASSVGKKIIFGMINSLLYEDCFFSKFSGLRSANANLYNVYSKSE